MKFESDLFREYKHLKDIRIPVNIKDVIERLKLQKGYCRNRDSNDRVFGFDCRDDGTVLVGVYDSLYEKALPYSRSFAIHGKLEEQDKETVLKLYVYRTRGMAIALTVSAGIVLICDIIIAIACILKGAFDPWTFLFIPIVFLSDGLVWFREHNEMVSWEQDREIFLSEIESRIKATIRWND